MQSTLSSVQVSGTGIIPVVWCFRVVHLNHHFSVDIHLYNHCYEAAKEEVVPVTVDRPKRNMSRSLVAPPLPSSEQPCSSESTWTESVG